MSLNLLVNGLERAGVGGVLLQLCTAGPPQCRTGWWEVLGGGLPDLGSSKDETPDLVWITSGICRMGSAGRGLAWVS